MIKKIVLLAGCLLNFSELSFADVSGQWEGTGTAVDSVGSDMTCAKIGVEFSQDSRSLKRVSGNFHCDVIQSPLVAFELAIKNNELWGGGKKLGDITANGFSADIPQGPMSSTIVAKISEDGFLQYEEKLFVGFGYMTIKGDLKKKEPSEENPN